MWKFIKECWNDWLAVENELFNAGIFRIYTVYGVFEYYNTVKKENDNESKTSDVV